MLPASRRPSEGASSLPALDGLRGVAVLGVLCFHGGLAWARGGMVWVSSFMALSGFLLTRNALAEVQHTGRFSAGHFLRRRLRRLAPAAGCCLAMVLALRPFFAASREPAAVGDDIMASALQIVNWRLVASEVSYESALLGGPSPVLHFWSLAVEWQFFVVFPLVVAAAVAWSTRRGRPVVRALGLALATALGLSLLAGALTRDGDLSYYGTHIRSAEFLLGALGAIAVERSRTESRRFLTVSAVVLLAATAWTTATVAYSGDRTYRLVLLLAAAAAAVTSMASARDTLLMRGLAAHPLRWVGVRSYGIYLYHWPIFLLFDEHSGWPSYLRWVAGMALTFVVAAFSWRFVESGIRASHPSRRWSRPVALVAGATAIVLVAGAPVARTGGQKTDDLAEVPDEVVSFDQDAVAPVGARNDGVTEAPGAAPPPPSVVLLGDPSVLRAVSGLSWNGTSLAVEDASSSACGWMVGGQLCDLPAMPANAVLVVLAIPAREAGWRPVDAMGLPIESADAWWQARVTRRIADLRERTAAPVVVLRPVTPRPVDAALAQVALGVPGVTEGTIAELPELVRLASAPAPVLVVLGDSVSYLIAESMNRVAPMAFNLTWAGYRNCPIVPAVRLRWESGFDFDQAECVARQSEWPALIERLRPRVILVVTTLTETSDHRYAGDPTWYSVLDEPFLAAHRVRLAELRRWGRDAGAVVAFTDLHGAPIIRVDRMAAWNRFLDEWTAASDAALLPMARQIDAAITGLDPLSAYPDRIHLRSDLLDDIVGSWLVPTLLQMADGTGSAAVR